MALGATIYTFEIDLADSDRGVYAGLDLRVARHPSETEDFLLTRVIAYCLEYTEGIEFSGGISDADQPAIAVRDLTGLLTTWIDIGAPEAARLHRASKLARRVAVYSHRDSAQLLARLNLERIHRAESLEIYTLEKSWLAALAGKLARRMKFSLTIADKNLYLSLGEDTFSGVVRRLHLDAC